MNIEAVADMAIRGSPRAEPAAPPAAIMTRDSTQRRQSPAEPAPEPSEIGQRETEQVVDGINAFLRSGDSHIQFALHEKSNRLMVEVINNKTQEVVRTFPPKELLDLAAKIDEMVGTIIDRKT